MNWHFLIKRVTSIVGFSLVPNTCLCYATVDYAHELRNMSKEITVEENIMILGTIKNAVKLSQAKVNDTSRTKKVPI